MNDVQSCINLLREIGEIANEASLRGSLGGGERRAAARYNATLKRLTELGAIGPDLFEPLPESAGYGEIGIEARMLASAAERSEESAEGPHGVHDPGILIRLAPFVDRKDLADMVRDQMRHGGPIDIETVTHLGPFLDRDVLGELLRGRFGRRTPPVAPEPPAPPSAPAPPAEAPEEFGFAEPAPDLGKAGIIARLKDPNLSPEERDALLDRLGEA